MPCGDKDRNKNDASTCQEMSKIASKLLGGRREARNRFSILKSSEETNPTDHLDL